MTLTGNSESLIPPNFLMAKRFRRSVHTSRFEASDSPSIPKNLDVPPTTNLCQNEYVEKEKANQEWLGLITS